MFEVIKNLFKPKQVFVTTTKGLLDETTLEKKEGVFENGNETTNWTEYWLDGELVHRSVHVTLKPLPAAQSTAGSF